VTPERWRRVREVFDRASEAGAGEREKLIARECGLDDELSREVRSLLASSAAAGEFLEISAVEHVRRSSPWPAAPEAPLPDRIGPWEIERELGHGGMGTVYLGVRSEGDFRRTAAVKLVRTGMDSEFVLRRFRTEREILSGLDHPHIARLLDGGSTAEGRPYFAMEYVEGRHLLEDSAARGLNARARIALFLEVCDAVAYAHRHLVVHRDLKPSNILVTPEGSPKLLDFGLARLVQPRAAEAGERTETAFRLLTPDYASPEQVRGERITTATDIYSLGVVLYHLLAGRSPYRTTGPSAEAIARAVCDQEPERPGVDRDLDNVLLMALRKEPERRYESVGAFAEDLKRYLDGRPVVARKDTLGYRAAKFIGRHRAGTAVAAAGALALCATMAAAVYQARVATRERAAAEGHLREVRELTNAFVFDVHDAIAGLPGATPARRLVVERALVYLERLSRVRTHDPALQRDLASAYERVARVQSGLFESHLGDTRGARESLGRALAIREDLAGRPGAPEDRAALAETELQLAQVLLVAGDAPAAARRASRASGLLGNLTAEQPDDPKLAGRAARARRYLGAALAQTGRRADALDALRSSAVVLESLAAADPSFRRELGITHQMIIHALAGSNEREAARASYAKASGIQEALIAADPSNLGVKRELAYTHGDMGGFLDWSGDPRGALACHRRALPLFEEIVQADPKNADGRLMLAETLNNVGYLEVVTGERDFGRARLDRSLRMLEASAAEDPGNARARIALARVYESLGTASADPSRARDWYRKSRDSYRVLEKSGGLGPQLAAELASVEKKLGD
jgi:non-specific serine/threonine protein kinase/serine/threonine-protein kinase